MSGKVPGTEEVLKVASPLFLVPLYHRDGNRPITSSPEKKPHNRAALQRENQSESPPRPLLFLYQSSLICRLSKGSTALGMGAGALTGT